jgi:hypothetical protein
MFSDAQQGYIAALVANMRDEYPYYIAYSDFRNGNYESASIYVIFTKEKITARGLYSYEIASGVKYALITSNYSSYNTNTARTVVNSFNGGVVTIPIYEFIYTNAEFASSSVQPDINKLYGGDYNAQLQTTNFIFVVACLTVMLLDVFFSFRRRL